ncbi:hypothetical protein [Paradevosia shaoguanensis]
MLEPIHKANALELARRRRRLSWGWILAGVMVFFLAMSLLDVLGVI